MRISKVGLALVCAAALRGQQHFSWQESCFNHPGLPYCQGHEYAVKQTAPPKDTGPKSIVSNPFAPRTRIGAPSMVDLGAIDWRFADPFPDALVGFNLSGLSTSPLARKLIAQLGSSHGLTEVDMQRIFAGLSGVDQIALSLHGNRVVMMATGPVADLPLPAPEDGLKATLTSGNAVVMGHAEGVDQAMQRIVHKFPPADSTKLAAELQSSSEFWAIGSAAMLGPQAMSSGVKRFSLRVSVRDSIVTDLALEFNGVPGANALRAWQNTLGASAVLEGNVLHVRAAVDGDAAQQKFAGFVASPAGARLVALVKAAQYLPVPDTTAQKTKPVIYGLDDGPKEVGQDSTAPR